jgi:predicted permease
MMNFIFIFINVIVPIFFQIAGGFVLQKKFNLDIGTLSKVQMYLLIPALLFSKIYESSIGKGLFISIMLYCVAVFFVLYVFSLLLGKSLRFKKSLNSAFINSVCLYNSGNYCIPLIQLLYNSPFALSVQIIVMMTQSILTNTFGIFNSNIGNKSMKDAVISTFKVPMVYVVLLAVIARSFHIPVWPPALSAMDMLGQGLVPLALLTLGAQLANTKFSFRMPKVYISNIVRLVIAPCLSFLLAISMGLHGVAGQVLVICSAAPTAVNSMLLAIEYDNEPDFASQAIFTSTIFSSITVTVVIFLVTKFL